MALQHQAYLAVEGLEPFQLKDYPQAFRSVINYGTRQLSGMGTRIWGGWRNN